LLPSSFWSLLQLSSMPLPQISLTPGWILLFLSLQSVFWEALNSLLGEHRHVPLPAPTPSLSPSA